MTQEQHLVAKEKDTEIHSVKTHTVKGYEIFTGVKE